MNELNTSAHSHIQSSIEIAVDQRQHIGKAAKLMPNSLPLSREWHDFIGKDPTLVRTVNSQTYCAPLVVPSSASLRAT
jgi:hypothetical protein